MVTSCKFCDSRISFGMRLLHGQYCSGEHKEAYLEDMDRRGLERLMAAQSYRLTASQPCTKPVELGPRLQQEFVH